MRISLLQVIHSKMMKPRTAAPTTEKWLIMPFTIVIAFTCILAQVQLNAFSLPTEAPDLPALSTLETGVVTESLAEFLSDLSATLAEEQAELADSVDAPDELVSSPSQVHNQTLSTQTGTGTASLMIGARKSYTIRWPNRHHTFQTCDETTKCNDQNADCQLGACVCKANYYRQPQSSTDLCKSVSELLRNCDNDQQCQAINVNLICDTKSHERHFCDCPDGLYFDQDTLICLPCLRVAPSTPSPESTAKTASSLPGEDGTNVNSSRNVGNSNVDYANSALSRLASGSLLRPCKPSDLTRLTAARKFRLHQQQLAPLGASSSASTPFGDSTSLYDQNPFRVSQPAQAGTSASSSDPFRIKTPLEVFMGAIMLFTLFTVAWFFLQRMIHDCRAILRSLRDPESFVRSTLDYPSRLSGDPASQAVGFLGQANPSNQFTSAQPGSARSASAFYDPGRHHAMARLFSGNTDHNLGTVASQQQQFSSIYQRDLAGFMVQHLAANLSPSSTSYAIVNPNGSTRLTPDPNSSNALAYPHHHLTANAVQQSRTAAAAAAAQLLLSPSHPALAILRAAAVSAAAAQQPIPDYAQANLISSMFDPPPKYEEAIAQASSNINPLPPTFLATATPTVLPQQLANLPTPTVAEEMLSTRTVQRVSQDSQLPENSDDQFEQQQQQQHQQILQPAGQSAHENPVSVVSDTLISSNQQSATLHIYIPDTQDQLPHSDDLIEITNPINNSITNNCTSNVSNRNSEGSLSHTSLIESQTINVSSQQQTISAESNNQPIINDTTRDAITHQTRSNSTNRRVTRRSRRTRGSISRRRQQDNSNDTSTESP